MRDAHLARLFCFWYSTGGIFASPCSRCCFLHRECRMSITVQKLLEVSLSIVCPPSRNCQLGAARSVDPNRPIGIRWHGAVRKTVLSRRIRGRGRWDIRCRLDGSVCPPPRLPGSRFCSLFKTRCRCDRLGWPNSWTFVRSHDIEYSMSCRLPRRVSASSKF